MERDSVTKNIISKLKKFLFFKKGIGGAEQKKLYKNYNAKKNYGGKRNMFYSDKRGAGGIVCWKLLIGDDTGEERLAGFILSLEVEEDDVNYYVGFASKKSEPFEDDIVSKDKCTVPAILKQKGFYHKGLIVEKDNFELAKLKLKIILDDLGWDVGSFSG